MPDFFPKVLYKGRARIEQAVGKLKRFKRIALRCEKTARNYGSFVALACAFILINSRFFKLLALFALALSLFHSSATVKGQDSSAPTRPSRSRFRHQS
jgi:Transposase DDE domain